MRSRSFFNSLLLVAGFAVLAAVTPSVFAQSCTLQLEEPKKLVVPRTGEVDYHLKVRLPEGCHANSVKPSEEYMIPFSMKWTPGGVEAADVQYPKASMEKYSFSDKPLSVYTGEFELVTKFHRSASATPGPSFLSGKLRYQACNDRMCFPPKTLDVKLPVLLQ